MLLFDEVRGQHSTGVLAVSNWDKDNTTTTLKKSVGGQASFFAEHGVGVKNDRVVDGSVNILMGHNRWATQGAINAENAHPFEFEHVIGAHNGTLPTYQARELEGGKDFDVDSQALYNHIDKKGVKDLWENTNGAMALTWYNKTDKTFNIARNRERPLWYVILDGGKTMVYASESWMIAIALGRADIKHGELKEVAVGKHFSLSIGNNLLHSKEEGLPAYKVRPFQNQSYYNQGAYGGSWRGGVYTPANQGGKTTTTKVVEIGKEAKVDRLIVTSITKAMGKDDEASEAHGLLSTGEIVRIHIPLADRKKAFKTFMNASAAGGYFITDSLRETVYATSRYKFVSSEKLEYASIGVGESLTRIYDGKEVVGFTYTKETPKIHSHPTVNFTSQEVWESMVEFGCDNCGVIPTFDKQETLTWCNPHAFVCEECANTPFIQHHLKA